MNDDLIEVPLVELDAHRREIVLHVQLDAGDRGERRLIVLIALPRDHVDRPLDEMTEHATLLAPVDARNLADALLRAADRLEQEDADD